MAKSKQPAYLRLENKDKNSNQEDLKKMVKIEERLRGSNDKIETPPDTLSDLGKAYYTFVVTELLKRDVLSNLDIPIIEQAADCLDKMQQLDEVLNEEGMFIEARDSRGNEFIKEHPAVKTKQTYLNQFRYVAGQLGMSPASRAQMAEAEMKKTVEETKPINKLMELKNKNKNAN